MGKKYRSKSRIPSSPLLSFFNKYSVIFIAILFFFSVCLSVSDIIKPMVMVLVSLVLICGFVRFSAIRNRITCPMIMLLLVVLMDGIAISYAVTRKLAMYDFLQVLVAFCLALLLLMLAAGKDDIQPGCWIATVLEGSAALAGLVSIDLISTRLISTPILSVLGQFTHTYSDLSVLIPGTRINSLFTNPNVFASIVGLSVFLSLGLSLSAQGRWERRFHLACLFINALSFVLAFSMGASAIIAIAFLIYLSFEKKGKRGTLFLLMAETLILTICATMLISTTSFQKWDGFQPIPLLCTTVGAISLCLLDQLVNQRIVHKFDKSRVPLLLIVSFLIILVIYIPVALGWTEGMTLQTGDQLRRSAYLNPGDYVLQVDANGPINVSIYSRNQKEVILETGVLLYSGSLSDAVFTVPEDSLVVYFDFSTEESAYLNSVTYAGANTSGRLPLKYKLLPSFIANRLQGALASTSGMLRLVIFSDALKLFRQSPIIGLGMGSFEHALKGVQSFPYVTQYVHNHYLQSMVDTGIIGLVLFVALIVISAAALLMARRKENAHPLIPALCAALFFMAGHAAVELIFSIYCYLPVAFSVFALIGLCCGDVPIAISRKVKSGILAAIAVLLCVFAVLLGENMRAVYIFQRDPSFNGLVLAAEHDKFEWADYTMAYVTNSINPNLDVDDSIRQQADIYAEQLSKLDSNIVPFRLAEYYFHTGRMERGFEMAEKYVRFVASDQEAWQNTFNLLARYETDSEAYRAGVLRIAQIMETWNAENIGTISVDGNAAEFIERMKTAP